MYDKYGVAECKFFCLDNDMVSLIEEKIYRGPFQALLEDINVENIAKLKLVDVRGSILFV